MEVIVPENGAEKVAEILKDQQVEELPSIPLTAHRMLIRLVVEAEEAETVTDKFRETFGLQDYFRVNLMALEATIPAHKAREGVEKEKKKETDGKTKPEKTMGLDAIDEVALHPEHVTLAATKIPPIPEERIQTLPMEEKQATPIKDNKDKRKRSRISKDELYSVLNDAVRINTAYFALIVLSVVVAAGGLVENNTAVIIGAMVIAPLLAPNVTLSLSTTLADRKLAGKALLSLSLGLILALALSIALGLFLHVDPTVPEIALRTSVGIGDVIIGLAAGAAAALFFSLGVGTALVGVTVAAALLPPLVVTGLLLGAGDFGLASQSLLLLVSNLIGINLAGTAVFIWKGVWPSSWWEEKKAKRTALSALVIWVALFLVLIFILLAVQHVIVFD